jgi:quaternary ammonium compound-resistance protein SugE
MSWLLLVLAGCLEVGWAIGLKYTETFTRPLPSAFTLAALIGSVVLLLLAVRDLPVGTAYAVWVGIGAAGTVVLSMLLFDEPATPVRIGLLLLIVVGVVGLQLTGGEAS